MVPTTACVKNRKGRLLKQGTGKHLRNVEVAGSGESDISNFVTMFMKVLLLTVLLGIFLYAISEGKPHAKETTFCSQKLSDEAESSVGDESGYHVPDESWSSTSAPSVCERKSFYVNLTKLLGKKIVAPDQPVDIGVCEGKCQPERFGKSLMVPFYPKTLRNHVVMRAGTQGYGCCTPYKFHSLTMSVENDNQSISLQKFEDTIVVKCGCIL